MWNQARPFLYSLIPLLVVLAVGFTSLSSQFDRVAYDWLSLRYQPISTQNRPIVLIDIDQSSVDQYGGWPFSRALHAQMIEVLSNAEASSITYNVAFVAPDNSPSSSDTQLKAAIANSGRVILPLLAEQNRELLPLAESSMLGATYAHADLSIDEDGVIRRNFLYAGVSFPRWPSLSLATFHRYAPVRADNYSGLRSPFLHIGFSNRWSRDFQVLLPFGIQRFVTNVERYSFGEVIAGKVDPVRFKNKAVFVGLNNPMVEPLIKGTDNKLFSATEIQAYFFSALEQGYALSPVLGSWPMGLGVVLSLLLSIACFWRLPLTIRTVILSVALMALAMPGFLLWLGYWFSGLPMLVALAVNSLLIILVKAKGLAQLRDRQVVH